MKISLFLTVVLAISLTGCSSKDEKVSLSVLCVNTDYSRNFIRTIQTLFPDVDVQIEYYAAINNTSEHIARLLEAMLPLKQALVMPFRCCSNERKPSSGSEPQRQVAGRVSWGSFCPPRILPPLPSSGEGGEGASLAEKRHFFYKLRLAVSLSKPFFILPREKFSPYLSSSGKFSCQACPQGDNTRTPGRTSKRHCSL